MEQIVRWLDRRTSGRLVFDERPDVYYDVVPSAKIEFEEKLKGTESYYHAVHT